MKKQLRSVKKMRPYLRKLSKWMAETRKRKIRGALQQIQWELWKENKENGGDEILNKVIQINLIELKDRSFCIERTH